MSQHDWDEGGNEHYRHVKRPMYPVEMEEIYAPADTLPRKPVAKNLLLGIVLSWFATCAQGEEKGF